MAGLLERTAKFLQPVLPRRFRGDMPVVPVVRLSGIIGFSTPLKPGLTLASVASRWSAPSPGRGRGRSRC